MSNTVNPREPTDVVTFTFHHLCESLPKEPQWDVTNRSLSLPGSQAFCCVPRQSGKAAYLKEKFN